MEDIKGNFHTSPEGFCQSSREYHLTIKDVLNFPIGEKQRIFFLDRNMFDMSCRDDMNEINTPIKPSHFFRHGYYIDFVRNEGILGDWCWVDGKTYRNVDNNRELDIDLGSLWYPLKESKVPIGDRQEIFKIPKEYKGKHYTQIPSNTRLGWRGPMILVKNMDKCPDIIYKGNYSSE